MTELLNEKKCKDCAHHTGDACDNSNSDHYGHMVTTWHQACNVFASLYEGDESKSEKIMNEYTNVIEGIWQCNDCGAHADSKENVVHHESCVAGESKKWEKHYD